MKKFLLNLFGRNVCRFACGFTAIVIAASTGASAEDFPVPDIIKPNVAFWVRIYTEVGLKEGLIHDTEYPQVVYEKVISGERTGKARSDYIDGRRKIYINAIAKVRDSAPDKWGAVEKQVAALFKDLPKGAIDSAGGRVRHQTGQRERFLAGLERSTIYLDTISKILKQHGVPDELKYLPHVESSFDAEAYSKVGAAGLWQFMRSTGRGYMKIDYMFDERRDGIKSTYAAAKFLKANYDMLGKWPLAVTAYNHGPNGMRRAVASVGSDDIAVILQRHESPSFKFASKNFYSCFVAVLQIMENPNKYFKTINYKPKFAATSITLPFAIRPDALLRATGVSEQEFKRLNPSFRPIVFEQKKPIPAGYAVNLPVSVKADDALAALDRTPQKERVTQREVDAESGSGYYTVVRGDNLNAIARRLGVSMAKLAAENNITNSSKIYVGQVLRIPSSGVSVAAAKPQPPKAATAAPPKPATPATPPTQVSAQTPSKTDTAKPSSDVQVAASTQPKVDTAKTSDMIPAASSTQPLVDTAKPSSDIEVAAATPSTIDTSGSSSIEPVASSTQPLADTARPSSDIQIASSIQPKVDTAKPSSVQRQPPLISRRMRDRISSLRGCEAASSKIRKGLIAVTETPAPDTAQAAAALALDDEQAITSQEEPIDDADVSEDTAAAAAAVPDSLAAVAFAAAEPEPAAPRSSSGKPSTDTRFDAAAYDLKIKMSPDGKSARVRVLVDETTLRFAEWARVYVDDIRKLNGMSPDAKIQLGSTISIPVRSPEQMKRFETNRLQYHMAIEEDFFANYTVTDFDRYKVRSGDNLWRICREAQIPMWILKKYNVKTNIFNLKIGDSLWIPKIAAKNSEHEVPEDFDPVITETDMN